MFTSPRRPVLLLDSPNSWGVVSAERDKPGRRRNMKGNPRNLVLELKIFSRDTIEKEKLTLPVKVELMDLGMNPLYVMEVFEGDERTGMNPLYMMEACESEERTYVFSKGVFMEGTVWRPKPYKVRFTAVGKPPFVKDFPG
jgi:hypothetical protein